MPIDGSNRTLKSLWHLPKIFWTSVKKNIFYTLTTGFTVYSVLCVLCIRVRNIEPAFICITQKLKINLCL